MEVCFVFIGTSEVIWSSLGELEDRFEQKQACDGNVKQVFLCKNITKYIIK